MNPAYFEPGTPQFEQGVSGTSATNPSPTAAAGGIEAEGSGPTLPPTSAPYAVPEPAGAQDTGVNPAYFEPGTPQFEQGVSGTSATNPSPTAAAGGIEAVGSGPTLPPTREPYAVPEPAGAQDTGVNPAYFEPGTPQYEQGVMGASSSKT